MLCYRSAQRTLRPENHGQVSVSQVSRIKKRTKKKPHSNRHVRRMRLMDAMLCDINKALVHFFFRFEIEIEPIFGTLALYDVKEKKKVFSFPPLLSLDSSYSVKPLT